MDKLHPDSRRPVRRMKLGRCLPQPIEVSAESSDNGHAFSIKSDPHSGQALLS